MKGKTSMWKQWTALAVCSAVCSSALGFVYETKREFVADGDFDGDGRTDVVLIDRTEGKVRIGYQVDEGLFEWPEYALSGVKDVSDIAVGRFFSTQHDSLAIVSGNNNMIVVMDWPNPQDPRKPVPLMTETLGPNAVAAVDIGGADNTPLDDVFVITIYNIDPPGFAALYRSKGGKFVPLGEKPFGGEATRGNKIALAQDGPHYACFVTTGNEGDILRVEDCRSGKPVTVLKAEKLPSPAAYAIGHFRASSLVDFVIYQPGENSVSIRPVEQNGKTFALGQGRTVDLGKPVEQVVTYSAGERSRMVVVFDAGKSGAVYEYDGTSDPKPIQQISTADNELISSVAALDKGFFVFICGTNVTAKHAVRYALYNADGVCEPNAPQGMLPSMADRDDVTVPLIHKRIMANLDVTEESQMKPYTNTIPGTAVKYVMIPIPGGEFLMGSPKTEKGHQPDEEPQHKVKISPFWMSQTEITWDAFDIFVYPDDEKKLREIYPTDPKVNEIVDKITRPSRPYTEMSFGMGKEGYPAISMTQHAANKFCHWLSAKTGHFYRLPTEAEWEYACRAGTTTAYSFGDDPSRLDEYAWYYDNSNEKYHKVGTKKPNPWGLYDMHGNVWEWCLDQYEPNYKSLLDQTVDPWNKATKPYPHVVRGGSYDDDPPECRSAARWFSDPSWKMRDPQLPKSIWWLTDAQIVGFRIVRPLKVPPPDVMNKYWNSGVERE